MIDAGLPLVQCLEILSRRARTRRFNKVLKDVKSHVEQGATFSDALAKHPKVFDELFCSLIHAGEMGGILDTILNRLAIYIEKNVKLKRQVKGALTYPLVHARHRARRVRRAARLRGSDLRGRCSRTSAASCPP